MGRYDIINERWAQLHYENGVSYIDLDRYDKLVWGVKRAWNMASRKGDEKMIRLLVKGGVNVNVRNIPVLGGVCTALEMVTYSGDVKLASVLLELGADWRQGVHQAVHESIPYWSNRVNSYQIHPFKAFWESRLNGVNRILRMCLRARLAPYKEELYAKALHPDRVAKWIEAGVDDMMFGF